ncbi:MAG TPA: BamA/TamA family outer membrane protein [Vicinamibacterales bacterium]|nr:BamA/TamA family outer membrane protein [Vicinamibacterales bacterium]
MRARRGCAAVVVWLAMLTCACEEEGQVRVKSLEFTGVNQVDEGALERALATRESSWLPWGRKHYFDRSRFEADLKRITAFYVDHGYPDARVRSVDVQLDEEENAVSIRIGIEEGEPILIDDVVFQGFDVLPENRVRELAKALAPGAPLDRRAFVQTREAGANLLADHGYPYGAVVAYAQPAAGDPHRVRLVFRAYPGPIASFGPIEIAGNVSVDDEVIRRELTFKPGDMYRRSRVRESQRHLYELELFEFANVEAQMEGQPVEIPMRVTVAEGEHRRVDFGVGYGTEEKLRADAQLRHANFLGDARSAGIHARWSSLDRGLRLNFNQPYFLRPYLSVGATGEAWSTRQPLFSADTLGGRVALVHRYRTRDLWSLAFVGEYQQSAATSEALEDLTIRDELIALGLDPRDGTQSGTLVGLEFDIRRNQTDGLLDARRGYYAALHLEQAGAWLPGAFDYYLATLEGRYYLTVADRAVLAARLQVGALDGIGRARDPLDETRFSHVPFSKRFFLGGSTSLRGWGRFEVSPLSGAGLPIGGRSMLEASTEIRLPVWGNLAAVGFVDAGNVWSDAWEYDLGDLRYAAGSGLRYQTPIGPVRVDFGYQLNPIEGLLVEGELERRRWRIHFGIGEAF